MDSTNHLALELAAEGAAHGTVVLADSQSAGRGRHGRQWASPPGLNIYMSVILRPEEASGLSSFPGIVPLMAGLCAVSAIRESTGLTPSLKWPNDILAGEKKLGGVLLEARSRGGRMRYAVLGIGINVNSGIDDFPPELRDTATSLSLETGSHTDMEAMTRALVHHLSDTIGLMDSKAGIDSILGMYRAACSTLGRQVKALMEGEDAVGLAQDIDPSGRLLLSTGGKLMPLSSADIIHLR